MKIPMSDKSEAVKLMIESSFPGTAAYIAEHKCPLCKKDIVEVEFVDALSVREYEISGLCQKCQDKVFGEEEE